ncbi:Cyclin, N-terminal domain-containing protein, partial [Diaporthe sp. PMI_573]
YCSKRMVDKQHYQLVGCTALLIAAKYGDKKDQVPKINELNNMCCGLYDDGMFTQMEMHILNTLEWNVGHPTVDFFQSIIWADAQDDREVRDMIAYVYEIALYHRDFISTKPSIMARASHTVARAILARPEVNDSEWILDCRDTLLMLCQHLHQPSVTLSRKYSSNHFSRVSPKLVDFLAQRASKQRPRVNRPITPPAECGSPPQTADIYSTPPKGQNSLSGIAVGYVTPPTRPDDVLFGVNG